MKRLKKDKPISPYTHFVPVKISVFFGILILLVLWIPFIYTIKASFHSANYVVMEGHFSIKPLGQVFNHSTASVLLNSLRIGLLSTFFSLIAGGIVAIAVQVINVKKSVDWLYLLKILFFFPLITPDIMIGLALGNIALESNIQINWVYISLAHSVFGSALVFFIVSAAYDNKIKNILEASVSLGIIGVKSLIEILGKLIRPAFIAGAIIAFVVSLDDFAVTYFLSNSGNNTFPVVIFTRLNKGLKPEHFAAAFILAALNLFLVIVLLRKFKIELFGIKIFKGEIDGK